MAQTKQVLLTITVETSGAWQANRFINFANAQASKGDAVYGVSSYEADQGDLAALDVIGIAVVEAGEAIAKGDLIATGDQGLAIKVAQGDISVGRALNNVTGVGEQLRVLLGAN